MKYLKLFEAFKSEILGSMMKFLSPTGKSEFLDKLKNLAKNLDFPMSEYSDEYFKYLPFKKALELNSNNLEELKWIKFWFDSAGNYIAVTGVDGSRRRNIEDVNIELYHKVKTLNLDDIKQLQTGDKVYIKLEAYATVVATVYRQHNVVYMIQDENDGLTPSGNDWKKFGLYSWCISDEDDFRGTPWLLKSKKEEVEESPYDWNGVLNLRSLYVDVDRNIEELIKKASFAIVLDYESLEKSEYKKKSEISKERIQSREGALALIPNDEFRKLNLDKYLDKIAQSVIIEPELRSLKNIALKMCGGRKSLGFVLSGSIDPMQTFMRQLYYYIDDQEESKRILDNLMRIIWGKIKTNSEYSSQFDLCINHFKEIVKEKVSLDGLPYNLTFPDAGSWNENTVVGIGSKNYRWQELKSGKPYLDFVDELLKVFTDFYNILEAKEIKDYDDYEFLYSNLRSLTTTYRETDKFGEFKTLLSNLVSYGYSPSYFTSTLFDMDLKDLFQKLTLFRKFVLRFIS
jgi:hypothetical protein